MLGPDDPVDVVQIMAGLRAKIRANREGGNVSEDEILRLTALELRAAAEDAEIDSRLQAAFSTGEAWNIAPDYRMETHRRGLSALAARWAKAVVRPFVRLYTDQPLARQAQINRYLVHLCHRLAQEVVRLRLENAARARPEERLPPGGSGTER